VVLVNTIQGGADLGAIAGAVNLLVLAVGGGELVNLLLKLLLARPRPVWPHPLLILTSASFPSTHAMRSVIFYGFLEYLAMCWIGSWRGRVWAVAAGGC
jgi:membrane-associated phospholipid phosphatase